MTKILNFIGFLSFLVFVFCFLDLCLVCVSDDGNAYFDFFSLRTQFLQAAATFAAAFSD